MKIRYLLILLVLGLLTMVVGLVINSMKQLGDNSEVLAYVVTGGFLVASISAVIIGIIVRNRRR